MKYVVWSIARLRARDHQMVNGAMALAGGLASPRGFGAVPVIVPVYLLAARWLWRAPRMPAEGRP